MCRRLVVSSTPKFLLTPYINWFSQKYTADTPLVLTQIEHWTVNHRVMMGIITPCSEHYRAYSKFWEYILVYSIKQVLFVLSLSSLLWRPTQLYLRRGRGKKVRKSEEHFYTSLHWHSHSKFKTQKSNLWRETWKSTKKSDKLSLYGNWKIKIENEKIENWKKLKKMKIKKLKNKICLMKKD